ncbi:MAG: hypothetical protein P1V81_18570, partial [Planctomycetota bacterium]|nr:hypothetical protein [Planctomycetota bacterium]
MQKRPRLCSTLAALVLTALAACAVIRVDVDVYQGPMANHCSVQLEQAAGMAIGAKPLLVQLRDQFEDRRRSRISWKKHSFPKPFRDFAKSISFETYYQPEYIPQLGATERFWDDDAATLNAVLYLYSDRIGPSAAVVEQAKTIGGIAKEIEDLGPEVEALESKLQAAHEAFAKAPQDSGRLEILEEQLAMIEESSPVIGRRDALLRRFVEACLEGLHRADLNNPADLSFAISCAKAVSYTLDWAQAMELLDASNPTSGGQLLLGDWSPKLTGAQPTFRALSRSPKLGAESLLKALGGSESKLTVYPTSFDPGVADAKERRDAISKFAVQLAQIKALGFGGGRLAQGLDRLVEEHLTASSETLPGLGTCSCGEQMSQETRRLLTGLMQFASKVRFVAYYSGLDGDLAGVERQSLLTLQALGNTLLSSVDEYWQQHSFGASQAELAEVQRLALEAALRLRIPTEAGLLAELELGFPESLEAPVKGAARKLLAEAFACSSCPKATGTEEVSRARDELDNLIAHVAKQDATKEPSAAGAQEVLAVLREARRRLDPTRFVVPSQAPKSPKQVIDSMLATLRFELIDELRRNGEGTVESKQIRAAVEELMRQRAGLAYLRPAAAYLRSATPATGFHEDETGWESMILESAQQGVPLLDEITDSIPIPFLGKDTERAENSKKAAVIDRMFWHPINRVRVSGIGRTNVALIKDDIGNWTVKGFDSDSDQIVKSIKGLALYDLGVDGGLGDPDQVASALDDLGLSEAEREAKREEGQPEQGGSAPSAKGLAALEPFLAEQRLTQFAGMQVLGAKFEQRLAKDGDLEASIEGGVPEKSGSWSTQLGESAGRSSAEQAEVLVAGYLAK